MKHFLFSLLTISMIASLNGMSYDEYLAKKNARNSKIRRDEQRKMQDKERREYKKANPDTPKKSK